LIMNLFFKFTPSVKPFWKHLYLSLIIERIKLQ
jgi:hypothetical protein